MNTKTCNKCKQTKTVSEFYKNGSYKNKVVYRPVCKSCYSNTSSNTDKQPTLDDLIYNLLHYARFDEKRLHHITERDFLYAYKFIESYLKENDITFEQIKEKAISTLMNVYGAKYPTQLTLSNGIYLIVSDSHGKHTKTKTFNLLHNIVKYKKITNIIHIGHLLDDDDDINYHWKEFDNLIIISKKEELRKIISKKDELNKRTLIVRDEVIINDISIRNQDIYTNEYTKTSITTLDPRLFNQHTIFNFHKHEMTFKTTYEHNSVGYMSPGCLCEQFVSKTRKTVEWLDGKRVKECYADTYHTYRRYEELSKLWEQGLIILSSNKNNTFLPVPCRIKDIDKDNKGISYMSDIITSNYVTTPDSISLITADTHVPYQDTQVLNTIDEITKLIEFDNHIHLGDICHNQSINHHSLDKNKISEIMNTDFMKDIANTSRLLSLMKNWGKHNYLLYANHERFIKDFTDKYPQLSKLFDLTSLFNLEENYFKLVDFKKSLVLEGVRYLHGNIKGYGCSGKIQEKLSKIYNGYKTPVMIGHIHYPSIQSGCYSVGLTGKLFQDYNERDANNWTHGIGMSSSYKGISWCTSIPFIYKNDDYYKKWDNKELKGVSMVYEFEDN